MILNEMNVLCIDRGKQKQPLGHVLPAFAVWTGHSAKGASSCFWTVQCTEKQVPVFDEALPSTWPELPAGADA